MLRERVQPFKLQVEELSRQQHRVPGFTSHQDRNQVRCQASLQDNISCKTLGSDVSTSQIVHCSWPVGMVKRIFPLRSREADVLPCKEEFISRLQGQQRFQVYHRTCCEGQSVAREEGSTCFLCFFCFCGLFLVSIRDFRGSCRTRCVVFLEAPLVLLSVRLGHCSQKSGLRGRTPFHLIILM